MYQQIIPHLSGITTWSNIPWYCIEYGSFHFRNQTLKSQNPFHIKLSHASYSVLIHWKQRIVNLTICAHCDYIRCHQWQQSCQNDNIMFSVIISIYDKILWIWYQGTALYVIYYQDIKIPRILVHHVQYDTMSFIFCSPYFPTLSQHISQPGSTQLLTYKKW